MSSPADADDQLQRAVSNLVQEGLLTEQFYELVKLQDDHDPNFLAELIELYFTTSEEKVKEMDRILDVDDGTESNYVELGNIAHKLKGSSASFGAQIMTELCSSLREACEMRQREGCRGVVAQQGEALEQLRARMREITQLAQGRSLPSNQEEMADQGR